MKLIHEYTLSCGMFQSHKNYVVIHNVLQQYKEFLNYSIKEVSYNTETRRGYEGNNLYSVSAEKTLVFSSYNYINKEEGDIEEEILFTIDNLVITFHILRKYKDKMTEAMNKIEDTLKLNNVTISLRRDDNKLKYKGQTYIKEYSYAETDIEFKQYTETFEGINFSKEYSGDEILKLLKGTKTIKKIKELFTKEEIVSLLKGDSITHIL